MRQNSRSQAGSRLHHCSQSLLLLLFLGNSSGKYAAQSKQKTPDARTGALQKMIVQSGSVTMQLELNRLNGINGGGTCPSEGPLSKNGAIGPFLETTGALP